jgi:hypothetical protein
MREFKLRDMIGGKYKVKAYTRNDAVNKVKKITGLYVYIVD